MSWDALATFAMTFVTLVGLNLAAIRWLLVRTDEELRISVATLKREGTEFSHALERELLQLRAQLPVEYVRREDWIRFSNTLEAKLDAMRAESRAELSELRELIYQQGRMIPGEETLA
ncbi:MAG TPA: hypothetical protein VMF50_08885 [Candidatus Binataceae bacterium]|nr:hypothetical protein [Candidatus Binataceae bacterium]